MSEGPIAENTIYKGFELSWPPTEEEEGVLYQVIMKRLGSFSLFPQTIYKGEEPYCTISGLEPEAEYEFQVRRKRGMSWDDLYTKFEKKVDLPTTQIAVNTLRNYPDDGISCEGALTFLLNQLIESKSNRI